MDIAKCLSLGWLGVTKPRLLWTLHWAGGWLAPLSLRASASQGGNETTWPACQHAWTLITQAWHVAACGAFTRESFCKAFQTLGQINVIYMCWPGISIEGHRLQIVTWMLLASQCRDICSSTVKNTCWSCQKSRQLRFLCCTLIGYIILSTTEHLPPMIWRIGYRDVFYSHVVAWCRCSSIYKVQ